MRGVLKSRRRDRLIHFINVQTVNIGRRAIAEIFRHMFQAVAVIGARGGRDGARFLAIEVILKQASRALASRGVQFPQHYLQ